MRKQIDCYLTRTSIEVLTGYAQNTTLDMLSESCKLQRGIELDTQYALETQSVPFYDYSERNQQLENATFDISLRIKVSDYETIKNTLLDITKLKIQVNETAYFVDGFFYQFDREILHNKSYIMLECTFKQQSLFYQEGTQSASGTGSVSTGAFDYATYENSEFYILDNTSETFEINVSDSEAIGFELEGTVANMVDVHTINVGGAIVTVPWYIKLTNQNKDIYLYPQNEVSIGTELKYINYPQNKNLLLDNIPNLQSIALTTDLFFSFVGSIDVEIMGLSDITINHQKLVRLI